MSMSGMLLPEFDQEMANTRKVLERLPMERLSFKPHQKSTPLGELAAHLVAIAGWTPYTLKTDALDMAAPGAPHPPAPVTTREGLLARFDTSVREGRAALTETSDEGMHGTWSLKMGARTIFTLPRHVVLRTFILNHSIHHRAQLEVYLRMNDVPLPFIYGPTADEGKG